MKMIKNNDNFYSVAAIIKISSIGIPGNQNPYFFITITSGERISVSGKNLKELNNIRTELITFIALDGNCIANVFEL